GFAYASTILQRYQLDVSLHAGRTTGPLRARHDPITWPDSTTRDSDRGRQDSWTSGHRSARAATGQRVPGQGACPLGVAQVRTPKRLSTSWPLTRWSVS